MRIRKRVTDTQLEANRRNSLKSTGPKTQSGKVHSSRNSWKHGILSAQVPVIDGRGGEDANRFDTLLAGLRKDFEPYGTMEDLLVQQIASGYWRLARVHRAEAGEIAKNSESVEDRFDEHQRQSVAEHNPDLMSKSSRGLEMFSETLRRADMELTLVGYLHPVTLSRLGVCFGDEVGELLQIFKQMTKDANTAPTTDGPAKETVGAKLIFKQSTKDTETAPTTDGPTDETRLLEIFKQWGKNAETALITDGPADETSGAKLTRRVLTKFCAPRVDELTEYVNAREGVRWNNDLLSASLPEPAAVDRLLRYETTIQRDLDRSLAQLESLQRRRKGETVPPPVRVQIER
jgi:hypothetical protein